jgi:hypothetical protein
MTTCPYAPSREKSRLSRWLQVLATMIVLVVIVGVLLHLLDEAFYRPTVYVGWDGRCLGVQAWRDSDAAKGWSCDHLPEKYEQTVVDPSWRPLK